MRPNIARNEWTMKTAEQGCPSPPHKRKLTYFITNAPRHRHGAHNALQLRRRTRHRFEQWLEPWSGLLRLLIRNKYLELSIFKSQLSSSLSLVSQFIGLSVVAFIGPWIYRLSSPTVINVSVKHRYRPPVDVYVLIIVSICMCVCMLIHMYVCIYINNWDNSCQRRH